MIRLSKILEAYTKEDLTYYAKQLGIGRISALRKAELAARIGAFLVEPEIMKRRLGILTDAHIALFEKVLEAPYMPTDSELDLAYKLNEMDYVFIGIGDVFYVTDDVKEAYKEVNNATFHEYRKQTSWLVKCLLVHDYFYGVSPLETLYEMYQKRPGYKIGIQSMKSLFNMIPGDLREAQIVGEFVVSGAYYDSERLKRLSMRQRDKPFYVPNHREVEDFNQHLYLSEMSAYKNLLQFLMKEAGMSYESADDCLLEVWRRVNTEDDLSDIISFLTEYRNLVFDSESSLGRFVQHIQDVYNNTRIIGNRGCTPNELYEYNRPLSGNGARPTIIPGSSLAANVLREAAPEMASMGFKVDLESGATETNVVKYPQGLSGEAVVTQKKIYPNDPCPCGSGKKYKKCCGRMQ